jgi:DNA-binding transcriptional MerR regulator
MPALLSIGELAARSGVAATALRYYDELGLVEPVARASGRRRYDEAAVLQVGTIVFLREIGFSLSDIRTLVAAADRRMWRDVIDRKLDELADQQHRIEVARTALEHGRRCPSGDPMCCPRFQAIIEGHRRGLSLEESHASVH